jgi:YcxB-like protein
MTTEAPSALCFDKIVTRADARDAVWYGWRRAKIKPMTLLLIFGSFLGAQIIAKVNDVPFWLTLPIVFIVTVVIVVLVNWFFVAQLAERMAKRAEAVGLEKWIVSDDGIEIQSSEGTVRLNWSSIQGYKLTKRLILLRLAGPRFLAITNASLTADQQRILVRYLDSKGVCGPS